MPAHDRDREENRGGRRPPAVKAEYSRNRGPRAGPSSLGADPRRVGLRCTPQTALAQPLIVYVRPRTQGETTDAARRSLQVALSSARMISGVVVVEPARRRSINRAFVRIAVAVTFAISFASFAGLAHAHARGSGWASPERSCATCLF